MKRQKWEGASKGLYQEYQGAGAHKDMFEAAYVQQNAEVIQHIAANSGKRLERHL